VFALGGPEVELELGVAPPPSFFDFAGDPPQKDGSDKHSDKIHAFFYTENYVLQRFAAGLVVRLTFGVVWKPCH